MAATTRLRLTLRPAHATLLLVSLALCACAPWAAKPPPPKTDDGREILSGSVEREETGPESISVAAPRYRLLLSLRGQREVITTRGGRDVVPEEETLDIELFYREVTTEGTQGDATRVGRLLILDAVHETRRSIPPPSSVETELANDRLRVLRNQERKPVLDLRGAQPKEKLTPRLLLGKPFALLAPAPDQRVTVSARGEKVAREFLKPLQLREAVGWMQVAVPEGPLELGATWSAGRFPPSPPGTLGLEIPIRHTYLGVQTLDGVECGHLSLEANLDEKDLPSAFGFSFDRATAKLKGEAWFDLGTRRVRRAVLEDDVRTSQSRSVDTAALETRYRYVGRGTLELVPDPGAITRWSDGSEAFGNR